MPQRDLTLKQGDTGDAFFDDESCVKSLSLIFLSFSIVSSSYRYISIAPEFRSSLT